MVVSVYVLFNYNNLSRKILLYAWLRWRWYWWKSCWEISIIAIIFIAMAYTHTHVKFLMLQKNLFGTGKLATNPKAYFPHTYLLHISLIHEKKGWMICKKKYFEGWNWLVGEEVILMILNFIIYERSLIKLNFSI